MKGIILAGGTGTRLFPITLSCIKQLLPIYDKPMIYYPLATLMEAGCKEILIISTPDDIPKFKVLFGDGSDLGIKIGYAIQEKPRGIAEALIIGEEFIGNDNVWLILGDNLFFGTYLKKILEETAKEKKGATIFGYAVSDPERYGVIEFDKNKVISIEEKPKNPKSKFAVTGLYYYDSKAPHLAKKIKPSARQEFEITSLNNLYLEIRELKVKLMDRGFAWLDTGTYDSLIEASDFVSIIEKRQGLKIGCIEEIAFKKGYITKNQLTCLAEKYKNSYGDYLLRVAKEDSNAV